MGRTGLLRVVNGAGFWVNTRFGFGLVNAAALTNAGDPSVFKSVPGKSVCDAATQTKLPR